MILLTGAFLPFQTAASLISLKILFSILVDRNLQPFRQGVYNGSAYAVQSAGHLISSAAEFSAGMKHCKHYLDSRKSRFFLNPHGNTAAIVNDRDGIILIYLNVMISEQSPASMAMRRML